MSYLGLDFGTANTSVAKVQDHKTSVIEFDGGHGSLPSAIFFDFENGLFDIGESAFERYYLGDSGRFLRSFKSALGTSTISHELRIKENLYTIESIIELYIGRVLNHVQSSVDSPVRSLVVGRPVHFVDDNPSADSDAQNQLEGIVKSLGVEQVEFQLEPIAAALNYGVNVVGEEVVLVIDIGAGTSDFSVVKFHGTGDINQLKSDVISNCGIHIGGNDFDKVIALNRVMTNLGYQHRFKHRDDLEAPKSYFLHASSWHQIDLLYDRKVINALREIAPQMSEPAAIERLIDVISTRQVHFILAAVEGVKKQFSLHDQAQIKLPFIGQGMSVDMAKGEFNELINPMCEQIINTANKAVALSGLDKSDIDTVYLTGGSMGLRHLYQKVLNEFSSSNVIEGDKSTAVARGLALDASRKFR